MIPKNWHIWWQRYVAQIRQPRNLADAIHMVCWYTIALLVAIMLWTNNPQDPTWWSASTQLQSIHNWLGIGGAYLAAGLLYVLGNGSYLIPFLCIYYASSTRQWSLERAVMLWLLPVLYASLTVLVVGQVARGGLSGMYIIGYSLLYMPRMVLLVVNTLLFAIALTIATHAAIWRWCWQGAQYIAALLQHPLMYQLVWHPLRIATRRFVAGGAQVMNWIKGLFSGSLIRTNPALIMHELELERLQKFLEQLDQAKASQSIEPAIHTAMTPQGDVVTQQSQLVDNDQSLGQPFWRLPNIDNVLTCSQVKDGVGSHSQADVIEQKLLTFGIKGKVIGVQHGPVITMYQYQPEADTKLSKISALSDDLALALQALSVRIIAPIPGTAVVGIEVPNTRRKDVLLGDVIRQESQVVSAMQLPIILGADTIGNPLVIDLAKAPHLLIAGSTGSGKSVCINTLLISLLSFCNPQHVRLVLIDPKRLEMNSYAGIPHLLQPIVHKPNDAVMVLQWIVSMMEERYQELAQAGVRDIIQYRQQQIAEGLEPMPYVVVVIDELADLMMTASAAIESSIARIAQMARAAGIHLVVATQRPSVDVITGVIKVNFPSRIAFRVTAKVDSRTIIDAVGAEQLLGRGDMLLMMATSPVLQRAHGAYVSDREIQQVTMHWSGQGAPEYVPLRAPAVEVPESTEDLALMPQVEALLQELEEVSISLLQRKLRIGFNRSARIIELLERQGKIAPHDGSKGRKVLRS